MRKTVHIQSVIEQLPGNHCPKCQRLIDGGTGISYQEASKSPKPGDISVCLYCGALLRYDEQRRSRLVDRKERRELFRQHPEVKELIELAERTAAQMRGKWQ